MASDTHDLVRRPNDMKAAYEVIASYDYKYAKKTFLDIPGVMTALGRKHAS